MIISEIGNIIPNFQIPYRSLNEVQCFSQSAHQFSFFDVVGCEVQSDYNFEFLSYVDPISFSMMGNIYGTDLIELTKWGDFINFQTEFIPLGDFWITNIFDEVFFIDGKTHLDSVAEAVFNAVLGALESFVKKIAELASKALDWIWIFINKIFSKPLEIIKNLLVALVRDIFNNIQNIALSISEGRQQAPLPPTTLIYVSMLGNKINIFATLLFIIWIVGAVVENVVAGISGGLSKVATFLSKPAIMKFVLPTIAIAIYSTWATSLFYQNKAIAEKSDKDSNKATDSWSFAQGTGIASDIITLILEIGQAISQIMKKQVSGWGAASIAASVLASMALLGEMLIIPELHGWTLGVIDLIIASIVIAATVLYFVALKKEPRTAAVSTTSDIVTTIYSVMVILDIIFFGVTAAVHIPLYKEG
jgi:hypothetical protein